MTEYIYHIARERTWFDALEFGEYLDASLGREGFIHCSTRDQVIRVANLLFKGQCDLVLVKIDPAMVASEIRYEGVNDEKFPHLYGPLNLDAVVDVIRFAPDAEGSFNLTDGELES